MGKRKKAEEDRDEEDALDAKQDKKNGPDRNEILAKRRRLLSSRKAATIHASPVDIKDVLLKTTESLGRVPDSIALRVKRGKHVLRRQGKRYDDGDNIFILTEMVKLMGSGVDGHDPIRNINIKELHGQVMKRFGPNYTQRQVYEKARRFRKMYKDNFLNRSADPGAVFESSSKEEIFNLCHQLWGDCGVMKLHLEDEEGPVGLNGQLGSSSRDAASSRENDFHSGLGGVVPGKDVEIHKGVHAKVDNNVPIVSSIHQDDSHGLKGANLPGKDMGVDRAAHAERAPKEGMHVCLPEDVAKKPGGQVTELAPQRGEEVHHHHHHHHHDNNQELLHAMEKKFDMMLEGMQVRLMTTLSNALEARDEPSMHRIFEMLKPAVLQREDKSVNGILSASMHGSNILIPQHLQDRWQRLRADELKLVSDRLHLMLEVCQTEQAKLERQIRHS